MNKVKLTVIAESTSFDTKTIIVPVGAEVEIVLKNQDEGVPHNIAVYENEKAVKPIFKGKIITGVSEIVYNFTAPATPGTYFFRCDVHPKMMFGDFIVK